MAHDLFFGTGCPAHDVPGRPMDIRKLHISKISSGVQSVSIAQLGERSTEVAKVTGSIPV